LIYYSIDYSKLYIALEHLLEYLKEGDTLTACDYCEEVNACGEWCKDETKIKPVGACDFSSSNEYRLYLKAKEILKHNETR